MNKVHGGSKSLLLLVLFFSSLTSIFSQSLNFDIQLSGNVFEYVVPCGEMKIDLSICNNTVSYYDPEDQFNIVQQVLLDIEVDAGGNLEVVSSQVLSLSNPADKTSNLEKSYDFFPLIGVQDPNFDGYDNLEIFPCVNYPLVYKRINQGTFYVTVHCSATAILSNGQILSNTYTKTLLIPEVIAMTEVSGKLSELQTVDSKHPHGYPLFQTAYAQSNPQYIKVIGDLEIDADYLFWEGTKILMDENAKIVVKQNKSLELANVNLFGCGTKWDKIAVENNAKLISYFSKLRDAKDAVFVEIGGAAYLYTNDFSFNDNCLFVSGPTANVVSTSNRFYGSNISTQFPEQLVKLGIGAKFTGYSSNYSNFKTGISATAGGNYLYLEGVTIETTSPSSVAINIGAIKSFGFNSLTVVNSYIRAYSPVYLSHSIGVRPFNTAVTIDNSVIYGSYGLYASNCPTITIKNNSRFIGSNEGATFDKYGFSSAEAAVHTTVDFQNSTFQGNKAISFKDINFIPRGKIIHCDGQNHITGYQNAVNVVNCSGSGLLVQNNNIDVQSDLVLPINAINIIGSRSVTVTKNNISANEIYDPSPAYYKYIGMGINIEGGFSNTAACNVLSSCPDPNTQVFVDKVNAISVKQSSNGNIEKNEIYSAKGLRMSGMCTVFENKIQGNFFTPCSNQLTDLALEYDNSAIVGEQIFRKNTFYSLNGIHYNPNTYLTNRYLVDDTDPALSYNLQNPDPAQWFVKQIPAINDPVYGNSSLCPNGIGNIGLLGKVDRKIMRSQLTDVPFSEAANWIGQRQLYRHLAASTAVDAIADSFVVANNNTAIGRLQQIEGTIDEALAVDLSILPQMAALQTSHQLKIEEIKTIDQVVGVPHQVALSILTSRHAKIIDLTSLEQQLASLANSTSVSYLNKISEASALLTAFSPNTVLEANEIAFWNFQLSKNLENPYSLEQKAVITQLAAQCSLEGGEPVLKARAIYREIFGEMPYYDEELCSPITPRAENPQLKSCYGTIYPNPASDEIRIAFADQNFSGSITLYNALLQQVHSQTIASQQCVISVSRLDSGVYTLYIQGNSGKEAHKVVVVK